MAFKRTVSERPAFELAVCSLKSQAELMWQRLQYGRPAILDAKLQSYF